MNQIISQLNYYPGHLKLPLFSMIPITHWVVDELHILLRIYDRLWGLALQECKQNGNFNNEMRANICKEMLDIGIKFHFWQESTSKAWNHTTLNGNDRLCILKQFNLIVMLPYICAIQLRKL
ncbi:20219_t:CDS:1 [Cetraspora pellucida]|uniref:20219_t:CDS:1 n=1 Tax=Cetraspora pellucida TaxID=1433469 RepID=A0A9N9HID4_9GLOM|nr:20219_t:CDS:1 [Cetraspora pellucida]